MSHNETLTLNGEEVVVLPFTGLRRAQYKTMLTRISRDHFERWVKDLSKQHIDGNALDSILTPWLEMSFRLSQPLSVDFEWLHPADSDDEISRKIDLVLHSEDYELIEQARGHFLRQSRIFGPTPPTHNTDKNSG